MSILIKGHVFLLNLNGSQGGTTGKKNSLANAGDIRDSNSIPGLGRSLGGGHGNPLQSSCLENPMDRGTRWAAFHGSHRVGQD